ncbi:hypothetical protein AB0M20_26885, partial [Actinoplanes sp. NPDC051633]|uniref:hypothetical protein n=1 Tax=Actinoplanes sp. NPDC051633 TaxID=3155670 RepID=UPI0034147A63
DTQAPRVRHRGAARPDHQTGLHPGALGRGRGGPGRPQRGLARARRTRIAERRGRNIATVAVARKLLTYVYYGLRDGHIRALDQATAA